MPKNIIADSPRSDDVGALNTSKKILIDALYPDDVRIMILDKNDCLKELICQNPHDDNYAGKADICLGTISRVEHALQAAFVDYGCEKSGFLPFSDIHPDYYQIPSVDQDKVVRKESVNQQGSALTTEEDDNRPQRGNHGHGDYKIQEVIRRGQNVLVQICRDEMGNKGAALTTYISLAGRCCILMPNTPGGVSMSHRVSDAEERQRLLSIAKELTIPNGASIVLRTASQGESAETLHRDYQYLIDLWDGIRDRTLKSKTMSVIYTEEKVIKQVMRDYYNNSVEQVIVSGKDGYQKVLECFENFAPEDQHKVVYYEDKIPLFTKYNVDRQIDELFSIRVNLFSGGYLIINQTEALVAIDVNSGKATSEKNVEDTALNINLEAAAEIARQIRLRGLGGLIIIDFIDMSKVQNRKTVESCLYEHMYHDRAKVKFTGISPFGLLEISRQRLRASFIEVNTTTCTTCVGSGRVKLPNYITNMILRTIETQGHRISEHCVLEIICSNTVSDLLRKKIDINLRKASLEIIVTPNGQDNTPPDFFSLHVKGNNDTNFKEIFRYDQDSLHPPKTHKANQPVYDVMPTGNQKHDGAPRIQHNLHSREVHRNNHEDDAQYESDAQSGTHGSRDSNRIVRRRMLRPKRQNDYSDRHGDNKTNQRSRRNVGANPHREAQGRGSSVVRNANRKPKTSNFFVSALKRLLDKF